MEVLVTGASSQIGYFLIPRLLRNGHQVIAVSRRDRPDWIAAHNHLRWCATEELSSKDLMSVRALVSAGPLSLTLQLISQCPELAALAVNSTSSIHFKRDSSDADESALINNIAMQEQQLRNLADQQGIACAILRPTMVYGAGLDRNVCLLAHLARRFGRIPVIRRSYGQRQPVHADDLAQACLRLIEQPQTGCWYVGGQTRLSYRQLADAVCRALEHGKLLSLSAFLLRSILKLIQLTGRYKEVNGSMFTRQQLDMCVDNQPAENDWGWQPRPFSLQLEALSQPTKPFEP